MTVAEIAEICGGSFSGDGAKIIASANTLEEAGEKDLGFVESARAFEAAAGSPAGCLIVPENFDKTAKAALVRADKPREAFAKVVRVLYHQVRSAASIHASAIIAPSATLGADSRVGPYTTVGEYSVIGEGCSIAAGCRIGANVSVGAGSTLHPNVTVYDNVRIGARVVLHAGCVIGADGFGYLLVGDHYEKFPQVGSVEIGDDVEIGANSCVDRAALGVTRIGAGSKLDNLVHIAHNCILGEHVVVAAQAGFSGSVTVGDYAMIGGQAGIGEKAKISAKAVVGGKGGILPGQRISAIEPVWGIPARPLRQHLKNLAYVSKLPEMHDRISQVEKKLTYLADAGSTHSLEGEKD